MRRIKPGQQLESSGESRARHINSLCRLVSLLCLVSVSWAAEGAVSLPTLSLSGNKRTQKIYINKMVRVCLEHQEEEHPGRPWSSSELRQCIMNSRLFSDAEVDITEQEINIKLVEKWTLIPIPAISAGSGKSRRAGAFLLESNFLGLGMTLGLGGSVSNRGSSYFAALADPSLFFSNWNYNVVASRQVEDFLLSEGERDTDGFREESTVLTGSLGYRWGRWSVAGSGSRQIREFGAVESFLRPNHNISNRVGFTLGYDRRDYKLYFFEGLGVRANTQMDVTRSDGADQFRQYEAQVTWQSAVVGDQALLVLVAGGGVEGGSKADAMRQGGARGFRGIEARTAWAERYYVGAIDYQVPVKSYESGMLTVAPFADTGRIYHRGGNFKVFDYTAVGGGVYFFLKKIALPGLGLEAGYNSRYMGEFFTLSAGLAM